MPRPAELELRPALPADAEAVAALTRRLGGGRAPATPGMIRGQIAAFAQAAFLVLQDGAPIGYAAAIRLSEAEALRPHRWAALTGGGYAGRHDGAGNWLYVTEMATPPGPRRAQAARLLRKAMRDLCARLGLAGAALAIAPRVRHGDGDAWLDALCAGAARDQALTAPLREGFTPHCALPGYRPGPGGGAVLTLWRNPAAARAASAPSPSPSPSLRVAAVQLEARKLAHPQELYDRLAHFTRIAGDYDADFLLFPEHLTLMLLSCEAAELDHDAAMRRAAAHGETYLARMRALAQTHRVNIIGGSHAARGADGRVRNTAYVFRRDGSVARQDKIHPTPDETACWGVEGGDSAGAIQTDCGPIGVMICYDSEFPEQARRLADEGAQILFTPYLTDARPGHLRVRYCCQARAIENQLYVVTAGMTGRLENVANADLHYAQSAILTPCDHPFARDGIAAEASENVEMLIFADLDLSKLQWARAQGAVRNLRDRRFDLYQTRWRDGG